MVNLFLSILSGFLLSAAFEPLDKWWLAPISIALHIFVINRSERKIISAFVFGLTFNLVLLHWTSIYVGSTPWLILAFGLAIFYIPLALITRWGIGAYPLIFLALEEVRNHFPFGGFGWARLAYSQADSPYSIVARFGGATGLSAIVLLLALFIFQLTQHRAQLWILLPLLLTFMPLNVVSHASTSALLIQGNVPTYGLDFNSRATQVFFNHVKESQKALADHPDVDFLLWPENAVDVDPFSNTQVKQALDTFTQPMIVGAIVEKDSKVFNTSILWTKKGQIVYTKQHLTPFGEYIPLRALASKISPLTDEVSDFSPGTRPVIFTINQAKIAPIICYELIDDLIVSNAAKGSNILAVQTNSATFGKSAESSQQLSITRIRAIEHSRNILSVSTTGYSALINFRGNIIQSTQMGEADYLYAKTGLINEKSPRDIYGDWSLVTVLIWLFLAARREYRYRR
ncbi:MAG: apolipoprotein N-acyltransferase [Actinomycetes bacterium]